MTFYDDLCVVLLLPSKRSGSIGTYNWSCGYDRILQVLEFCSENNYLPFMFFLYRKSLFKIVFWGPGGRTSSIVDQFSIFGSSFLDKLSA